MNLLYASLYVFILICFASAWHIVFKDSDNSSCSTSPLVMWLYHSFHQEMKSLSPPLALCWSCDLQWPVECNIHGIVWLWALSVKRFWGFYFYLWKDTQSGQPNDKSRLRLLNSETDYVGNGCQHQSPRYVSETSRPS